MFMSMGWDYFSELWPPTGLLFFPSVHMWVWKATVEWYWQRKPKNLEKISPSATLSDTSAICFERGTNPGSVVTGRRLTAWDIARPENVIVTKQASWEICLLLWKGNGSVSWKIHLIRYSHCSCICLVISSDFPAEILYVFLSHISYISLPSHLVLVILRRMPEQ
jgi:hypothetical protein